MILSISNIAWGAENDEAVFAFMRRYGYTGLEIAPTRIFPDNPYSRTEEARLWGLRLREKHGLLVPSMQSIWYGRQERLFGTAEEREELFTYTKQAINFAAALGCKNLVFGCPRNRNILPGEDPMIAVDFFRRIGEYAAERETRIGLEANPPIYRTNYINTTSQALKLIQEVDSPGFRLNLDIGTMIANGEDESILEGAVGLINHVHISEPGLNLIKERSLHDDLKAILERENYQGFVSIEMGRVDDMGILEDKMAYVRSIFA